MRLTGFNNGSMEFAVEPGDLICLIDYAPDQSISKGEAKIVFPATPFPDDMVMEFEFETEVTDLRWALVTTETHELIYLSHSHGPMIPGSTFTLKQD